MKDNKNDSTTVLSRFGRDKRQRTVTATAERVERRPRLQRDAADSEQPSSEGPRGRASYNPHFTADNRPAFDKPRRQFGDKPAYGERKSGDKPRYEHRDGDKPRRQYGDKPAYGERKFGDKKFGDRKFGDKPYKPGPRKHDDKPASYPKFTPEKQVGEMRLNRFLAQSGLCSRREADDFITAGLVTVNGQIVTQLGTKVLPTDEVKFNDSRVQGEKKVYLVLNKPKGYVTSLDDPHAGKTVMDLVEGACTERIYPVGRLDKNSLGLLLFTNDGDLTKQLTHPSYLKKKIYQVTLDKPLARADMDRIAEGITLEDGEIFADEISYVKENKQEIGIEIHSGRNRIVRRIFEFLGYTVTKLDRVYYAGLTKKNLKRGAWRFLSREEVERLKSGQYE
jgi:23S rRNA pseudouridine2605 synthase